MGRINALGFVEVYGLVPGIEAADAMLKSAQVRLLRQYAVRPGLITVAVEGDLASCQAAVNAGVAAASRVGKVVSSLLIPRPDGDTETMVLDMIPAKEEKGGGERKKTPAARPGAEPEQAAPARKKSPATTGRRSRKSKPGKE